MKHTDTELEVCDLFNVPPHVVLNDYPTHRWTWQLRRHARMAARRIRRRMS